MTAKGDSGKIMGMSAVKDTLPAVPAPTLDQLLKCMGFLILEEYMADGEGRKDLGVSANAMNTLAEDIEDRDAIPSAEIRDAFARTEFSLGMHSWTMASEAWKRNDLGSAAADLQESQTHLQRAIVRACGKANQGILLKMRSSECNGAVCVAEENRRR